MGNRKNALFLLLLLLLGDVCTTHKDQSVLPGREPVGLLSLSLEREIFQHCSRIQIERPSSTRAWISAVCFGCCNILFCQDETSTAPAAAAAGVQVTGRGVCRFSAVPPIQPHRGMETGEAESRFHRKPIATDPPTPPPVGLAQWNRDIEEQPCCLSFGAPPVSGALPSLDRLTPPLLTS